MADTLKRPALAEAKNGVVAPLYFDRQVIRAEDLTLDRASHDQELARMRRLLHGWGVVAGLIPVISEDTLAVSAGYGITRTGDEVYLTEALLIPDIVARAWGCCGPGRVTCEVIDLDERRRLSDELENGSVTSWLVARPTLAQGSLRAGIAEGCAHPANRLLPTRACDVVSIELLCELPDSFVPPAPACEVLSPFFCGTPTAMLPMPAEPAPEDNFLVLGRIVASASSATFEPLDRRTVLPMSVVQDWLHSCFCPLLAREVPPVVPPGQPDPAGPGLSLDDFVAVLVGNGFRDPDVPERVAQPAPGPRVPELVADPEIRAKLGRAGIRTTSELFAAEDSVIAAALGKSVQEVATMKAVVRPLDVFAKRPRL